MIPTRPLLFTPKEYKIIDNHLMLDGSYADYKISIQSREISIFNIKKNLYIAKNILDISYISFSDLKNAEIDSLKSYPVSDIIDVNNDGPYIIDDSEILKNDIDFHNNTISIQNIYNAIGGTIIKDFSGKFSFNVTPGYKGLKSCSYDIINSKNIITQGNNIKIWFRTPNLPKDPGFFDQGYLDEVNVHPAWEFYKGRNVTVVVFDDGWILDHPDIGNNLISSTSCPLSYPKIHHALAVAGVIAAEENGKDLIGIAPSAKIANYLMPGLSSDLRDTEDNRINPYKEIDLSFHWDNETDIINNSWAGKGLEERANEEAKHFKESYRRGAEEGRNGKGSSIVHAAGNDKTIDVSYSSYSKGPHVIVVGGINKPGSKLYLESQTEPFATEGTNVLVSAPASHIPILSTKNCRIAPSMKMECEHGLNKVDGTSFSAPTVTGVIALMYEANPALGFRDVQEILSITAKSITNIGLFEKTLLTNDTNSSEKSIWNFNNASNWNNGGMHYSRDFGFGIVDAYAAVKLSESWTLQQTSKNFISSSKISPNSFKGDIKNDEILSSPFLVEENFDIEFVEIDVTIDKFHFLGSELYLKSPAKTISKILINPCKKAGFTYEEQNLHLIIGSTNFRGEKSKGKWEILVKNNPDCLNPEEEIKKNVGNSFNLNLYGKKVDSTETYFTNEFLTLENRAITQPQYKTLNAAAVSGPVNIDLTGSTASSISGKEINLGATKTWFKSFNISIVNIKTGDGDDKLIGNKLDNIFMPGRGNNEIYTGGGKDIIYFPNLNVHRGNTTIHNFKLGQTKIQFGHDISINDINSTVIEQKVVIKGEAWSISLSGINEIPNNSFIFEDLFF